MISHKLSLPLLVLVGIVTLLFGLWPLDFFPENQVRWLAAEDGVQFYREGISNRRATGGVIYSVGYDGVDNGGEIKADAGSGVRPERDIGVRVPR